MSDAAVIAEGEGGEAASASSSSSRPAPPSSLSSSFCSTLYSAVCQDGGVAPSEVGLAAFNDGLLEASSTRALQLRGLGIGHAASTALLSLLLPADGELRHVRMLDLTGNALRSFGCAQLLTALQAPHIAIQVLQLGDNDIGPAGISEMAKVLINNRHVRTTAAQPPP